MKKPNIETVKAVRQLLSDPKRWIKGSWSNKIDDLNLGEHQTLRDDPTACFCLLGAFAACSDIGEGEDSGWFSETKANDILVPCIEKASGATWTPTFNDAASTTHEDVLKVLDCTIARLSGEAPIS